jgi:hypothetical protein
VDKLREMMDSEAGDFSAFHARDLPNADRGACGSELARDEAGTASIDVD